MVLDFNTIIRFLIAVVILGVALLAITVLAEFLIPIIFLIILIVGGYLAYKFITTGHLGF